MTSIQQTAAQQEQVAVAAMAEPADPIQQEAQAVVTFSAREAKAVRAAAMAVRVVAAAMAAAGTEGLPSVYLSAQTWPHSCSTTLLHLLVVATVAIATGMQAMVATATPSLMPIQATARRLKSIAAMTFPMVELEVVAQQL